VALARRSWGTVRKLPSGRFQARYSSPNGGQIAAPQTFLTKADATRWLSRTETEVSAGKWIDPRSASATLDSYAAAWLKQRTVKGKPLAPRTLQTYQHSLDAHILPKLGKHKLSAITPAVVRAWHSETLPAGPTAARQAYALLRAIFNTAVADDIVARNPCRIVGAGQPNTTERPLLDVETVMALVDAMPEYLRVFTLVTFWAHLRIGEAVALQWRDIDFQAGTLAVQRQHVEIKGEGPRETPPKMSSIRTIHLPTQAVTALVEHRQAHPGRPSSYVFTRRDGSQLRAMHAQNAFETARKKVGVPSAHVHDLRHAGLTLTAQLGATTAETMRRAGHSSARAAQIYQHAAASRDKDLAALLSKLG
jgi:integrase